MTIFKAFLELRDEILDALGVDIVRQTRPTLKPRTIFDHDLAATIADNQQRTPGINRRIADNSRELGAEKSPR
jgi:hypothetical protein